MNATIHRTPVRGLAALRRIANPVPAPQRCELCSSGLDEDHEHLVEPSVRRLVCCCTACAILFDHGAAQRYRRVPRDILELAGVQISDVLWNRLGIPIGLAFFFRSSVSNALLAVYPSPAGPAEIGVDESDWPEVEALHPAIGAMERDVQALLVNRINGAREYYLVPIDQCYKLTGMIRTHWTGISGGDLLWQELRRFFDRLKERHA